MADTRGIRAGRAYVELGVSDKLAAGLKRAQARLQAFGAGVTAIGGKLAVGGAAMLAPFIASAGVFIKAGDQLDKMAARTGISVEALSELGYAASQSGTNIETLEKGIRTLQRSIADAGRGLATQTDALEDLGLTYAMLTNLNPEQQFKTVAEAISRIEDPSKRAALAMMLLGRAGTMLLPLMQDGAAGMEALQDQARALGLTISTETARDAAILGDRLDDLKRVVRAGAIVIGSTLAPALLKVTKLVTSAAVAANDWIRENKTFVAIAAAVAASVLAAGLTFVVLGAVISGVGAVFGLLATAVGVASSVLGAILSPIGLVVAAVAGLGVAILKYSGAGAAALQWLGEQFGALKEAVGPVVQGIVNALTAGDIQLAARVLWAGLNVVWENGVAALNSIWIGGLKVLVGAVGSVWTGVQTSLATAFLAIGNAWHGVIGSMNRAWISFAAGVKSIWANTVAIAKKGAIELRNVVDPTYWTAGRDKAKVDDALRARTTEIANEKDADLAAVDEKAAERRRKAGESFVDRIGAAGATEKLFDGLQSAIDTYANARAKGAEAELAEAQRQLDEALRAADEARASVGPDAGPRGFEMPDIDGISDTIARRVEARGTFNAGAIQSLQSGGVEDKSLKIAEQSKEYLKRLASAARGGGLVFA